MLKIKVKNYHYQSFYNLKNEKVKVYKSFKGYLINLETKKINFKIKKYFNNLINNNSELKYFLKSLSLFTSKFVCLQAQTQDQDEEGNTIFIWENIDSSFTWSDPYYVCALFSNGKHLPLPLVLENKKDKYGNSFKLQNMVLTICRKLKILNKAIIECESYKSAFNSKFN